MPKVSHEIEGPSLTNNNYRSLSNHLPEKFLLLCVIFLKIYFDVKDTG